MKLIIFLAICLLVVAAEKPLLPKGKAPKLSDDSDMLVANMTMT
jgi:hypothetical protein